MWASAWALARMSNHAPIVVLGHQWARPGAGADLTALNVELAATMSTADPTPHGLLAYQPLGNVSNPDRTCVYWLWRGAQDRDETWADPPDALRRFWRLARPLWRDEPVVGRYVWSPVPVRVLCPRDSQVALSTGALTVETGRSAARWLVPESRNHHGQAVRVDVVTPTIELPTLTLTLTPAPEAAAAALVPGRWAPLCPPV